MLEHASDRGRSIAPLSAGLAVALDDRVRYEIEQGGAAVGDQRGERGLGLGHEAQRALAGLGQSAGGGDPVAQPRRLLGTLERGEVDGGELARRARGRGSAAA